MEIIQELFFNYIKRKTPNIDSVLEVKFKKGVDDNEHVKDHYEVRCVLRVPDASFGIDNWAGRKEKTCLIDYVAFSTWVAEENSIQWL